MNLRSVAANGVASLLANAQKLLKRLHAFGCQTVKNLRLLALKFDLDQSERKSSQASPFGQGFIFSIIIL